MATIVSTIEIDASSIPAAQSQIDALGTALEGLEAYGPRISTSLGTIGQLDLSNLLGSLDTGAASLSTLGAAGDTTAGQLASLGDAGVASLDSLTSASDATGQSLSALGDGGTTGLDALAASADSGAGALGTLAGATGDAAATGGELAGSLQEQGVALSDVTGHLQEETGALSEHNQKSGEASELGKTLGGVLKEQGVPLGELTEHFNQLREGMAHVTSEEESTTKGMELLTAGMVGLAVVGIGKAVEGFTELVDMTHEISETTGVTTKTVQGLGYAFQTIGDSAEAAQRPLMLLERNAGALSDQLDKGAVPSGKFASALDKLGISAQAFVAMNPDERIRAIMDAFSRLGEETNKTQLAMDLFGRSGASMIGVLDQGSAAIDKGIAKISQYGASVGDSWAIVQQFHTAQADMNTAWQGLEVQLGSNVLPILSAVTEKGAEMVGAFGALPGPVKETATAAGLLALGVTGAAVAFDLLGTRAIASLGSLKTFMAENPEILIGVEVVGALALGYEFLKQKIDGAGSAAKTFAAEQAAGAGGIDAFVKRLQGEGQSKDTIVSLANEQIGVLTGNINQNKGMLEGWANTLLNLQHAQGDHTVEIAHANAEVKQYTATVADQQGKLDGWKTAIGTVNQAQVDLDAVSVALAGKTQALVGPMATLGQVVAGQVVGAFHALAQTDISHVFDIPAVTPAQTAVQNLKGSVDATSAAFVAAKQAEDAFFAHPSAAQDDINNRLTLEQGKLAELTNTRREYAAAGKSTIEIDSQMVALKDKIIPGLTAEKSGLDGIMTAVGALRKEHDAGAISEGEYNRELGLIIKNAGDLGPDLQIVIDKLTNTDSAQRAAAAAAAVLRDATAAVTAGYKEGVDYGIEPWATAVDGAVVTTQTGSGAIAHASDQIPPLWQANLGQIPGMLGPILGDAEVQASAGGAQIGSDLGAGINAGMAGWVGSLAATAAGLVTSAIAAAKAVAEAHSPSEKAAREIGEPIPQGIALGITRKANVVNDAMNTLLGGALGAGRNPDSLGIAVGQSIALAIEPHVAGAGLSGADLGTASADLGVSALRLTTAADEHITGARLLSAAAGDLQEISPPLVAILTDARAALAASNKPAQGIAPNPTTGVIAPGLSGDSGMVQTVSHWGVMAGGSDAASGASGAGTQVGKGMVPPWDAGQQSLQYAAEGGHQMMIGQMGVNTMTVANLVVQGGLGGGIASIWANQQLRQN